MFLIRREILARFFVESRSFTYWFALHAVSRQCVRTYVRVCVTRTPPPAHVTLGSFSTRGFTRAAITIITSFRASFRDRATGRCPLTLRGLRSFCEIDLTYSLGYANRRRIARLQRGFSAASTSPRCVLSSIYLLLLSILHSKILYFDLKAELFIRYN